MIETVRADELIPGDIFDTRCGVGSLAFREILTVVLLENDNPNAQDRIRITYAGEGISNVRTLLADYPVRIAA